MAVTAKEIKKLAEACRKAGLKTFKCPEFEFTLGDAPVKPARTRAGAKATTNDAADDVISQPQFTEEELLLGEAVLDNAET